MSNEQTEALDVPVTDADRAAAKELMHVVRGYAVGLPNDGHFAIQAFARHRIAATPSPAPSDTLDAKAIAASVVQSACETDPADPEHPDTVCIEVADLETIVRAAVENALEALGGSHD